MLACVKFAAKRSATSLPHPRLRVFAYRLGILGSVATISSSICWAAEVPKQLTMPAGGPGAATNLTTKVEYDPVQRGKAAVHLHWTPSAKPGGEQRVVVTIFPDGFERGAFEASSPLRSNQTSLVWEKLKGQAIHRWKVLTLQPEGWVPSETGSFEGPILIRDRIERNLKTNQLNLNTNKPAKEFLK